MRFFEAEDWMNKVLGVAWVVAIGVVTGVVVAAGVAIVRAACGWPTGSDGGRNGKKPDKS